MKIGIFAPSQPLVRSPKETDYKYLKSKGFEVAESPQVRTRFNHLAGTVQERVDAIHNFLKDETVDILMAYWGGSNSNQLLDFLDYDLFKKYPKPIVGFSDVSALLLAVNRFAGIRTYMGPSAITFDKPETLEYSFEYFDKAIRKITKEIYIEDSPEFADDLYFLREDSNHRIFQKNVGRKVYKSGIAEGEVIASNLQTLLVLSGTKYFPVLENKILFLEEAEGEDTSMIHRFLTQLSQVQDLTKLKGICFGRFATQSGFKESDTFEMILDDIFKKVEIPIVYNLDFGHTDPLFTIPIGAKCKINTSQGQITFVL